MNGATFIVCVICIIRKQDKILIMKRSDDKCEDPGCWEMVAGKLEHNEKPYDAVCREVSEETGLTVSTSKNPFYVFDWKVKKQNMLMLCYEGSYLSGDVSLSSEHTEYKWVTQAQLLEHVKYSEIGNVLALLKKQ